MRRLAWGLGAGLLLALAVWWALKPPPAKTVPATAGPAVEAAPDAVASAAIPASTWPLALRLLPDGDVLPRSDGIRLGLAYVPPDEARRWQAWVEGGRQGAGPARYAELAQVQRWVDLTGERASDGSVHVAAELPAADRYDLQARGEGALHYYATAFERGRAPATLAPQVAAGLRIAGLAPGGGVLLRRSEASASAPAWQELMAREAPALLAAYDERPLVLEAAQVLAPLSPGPLGVVAVVDGVEAERRDVVLQAGRVQELRFDALTQDVARALSAQWQLTLVETGGGAAIPAVAVTWHTDRGDEMQRSDGSGKVRFGPLDPQRSQRISLEFPAGADAAALPRWPTTQSLELALPPPSAGVVRQRLEFAPLRWLVVHAGTALAPFHRGGGDPYPLFVLQQERRQRWHDAGADYFLPQPQGLAISIGAPGRYRLLALAAPWSARWSEAGDTADAGEDGRIEVALPRASGRRVELSVLHHGRPLSAAPLHLIGPAQRSPPKVVVSDADGRARLENVTVDEVTLEVPGYAAQRVDLRGTQAVVELQRQVEAAPAADGT